MSTSNKAEKSTKKRKKNMVSTAMRWIIGGMVAGFVLTLIISFISACKIGLGETLTRLVSNYFDLILEITGRNPSLANFILEQQSLAEAEVYQGLSNSSAFIATNFPGLGNSTPPSDQVGAIFDSLKYHICGFFYLVEWSLKLDVLKFISVFCSFMVFVFAAILGLLDGLLTRYIRTAEGGRESTYVYHHLADVLFKIPFCLVVAYLALPFSLNPLLIVVILGIATFLFCKVSTSNLKKYM